MKNFHYLCDLDVKPVSWALATHSDQFHVHTERQTYPGTAHSDTLALYLRAPHELLPEDLLESFDFVDYPMSNEPVIRELLDKVETLLGKAVVRAMVCELAPGGRVLPHTDKGGYAAGTDRFHLPIVTNSGAWLRAGVETMHLPVGTLWAFDKHVRHCAQNDGATPRQHLIVDTLR